MSRSLLVTMLVEMFAVFKFPSVYHGIVKLFFASIENAPGGLDLGLNFWCTW